MIISREKIEVFDHTLPAGTPLVYEIVGGEGYPTVRGIVTIGTAAKHDIPVGTYEVRLVHPRLGRLSTVLEVSEADDTIYFKDMQALRDALESERSEPKPAWRRSCAVTWWHTSPRSRARMGTQTVLIDEHTSAIRPPRSLPVTETGIAVVELSDHESVAVRLPPGTDHLELQPTRQGPPVVRPRISNPKAESMLDYAMEGYPKHAATIRGEATAYELLDRELQSPAGALIGAYYLLRTGEASQFVQDFETLTLNFPELPDAAVAFASALLQLGAPPLVIRASFLRARDLGIPVYREGLRRLRAGLDYCLGVNRGDHDVLQAIEQIRPYQFTLRYDNAVTSWSATGEYPEPMTRSNPSSPARGGGGGDDDVELFQQVQDESGLTEVEEETVKQKVLVQE